MLRSLLPYVFQPRSVLLTLLYLALNIPPGRVAVVQYLITVRIRPRCWFRPFQVLAFRKKVSGQLSPAKVPATTPNAQGTTWNSAIAFDSNACQARQMSNHGRRPSYKTCELEFANHSRRPVRRLEFRLDSALPVFVTQAVALCQPSPDAEILLQTCTAGGVTTHHCMIHVACTSYPSSSVSFRLAKTRGVEEVAAGSLESSAAPVAAAVSARAAARLSYNANALFALSFLLLLNPRFSIRRIEKAWC